MQFKNRLCCEHAPSVTLIHPYPINNKNESFYMICFPNAKRMIYRIK